MDDISSARDDIPSSRFAIYRADEARDYAEHDVMALDDISPVIAEGLTRLARAGDGASVKLLYGAPGFSLTRVWFKSGYPLPLHSHNSDCLYYILAGTVKAGTETLGPGDGFFVGADVPYTYTPGSAGVEVLEFRNTNDFNIRFMGKTRKVWDKIADRAEARSAAWQTEAPPTATAVPAE